MVRSAVQAVSEPTRLQRERMRAKEAISAVDHSETEALGGAVREMQEMLADRLLQGRPALTLNASLLRPTAMQTIERILSRSIGLGTLVIVVLGAGVLVL